MSQSSEPVLMTDPLKRLQRTGMTKDDFVEDHKIATVLVLAALYCATLHVLAGIGLWWMCQ